MWYFLKKDGVKIDTIHTPSENNPFTLIDRSDLVEQWFNFDDESIQKFFMRVCKYRNDFCYATIDGYTYSVEYEGE